MILKQAKVISPVPQEKKRHNDYQSEKDTGKDDKNDSGKVVNLLSELSVEYDT
jgi:hypothetical protein